MEVHNRGNRYDVRHVRKPCERHGAEGIFREEGHLLPEQKRDHSDRRDGTGRGCPAHGHFRHRL